MGIPVIPIAVQLLKSNSSRALITKQIIKNSPKILTNDPPKAEENKFQDRLKKEREVQKDDEPEKGRGRGEDKINNNKGLDNPEKSENAVKEILKDGPQNNGEKIIEKGPNDKAQEIIDKGTDNFRQRIIEERGWSPEEGAKIELENSQPTFSDIDKGSFLELASLGDNFSPEAPIFDIEMSNLTFPSDYESIDSEIDFDGGDDGGFD